MTTMSIETLLHIVRELETEPASSEILDVLQQDRVVSAQGFPPCVVVRTEHMQVQLQDLLPEAVFLPPYDSATRWSAGHFSIVERCGTLVVVTKARQLVPYSLSELLKHADDTGIPVEIIVMDPGRVADITEVDIAGQLKKLLPTTQCRWSLVGDERVEGEPLKKLVREAAARVDPPRRNQHLVELRQRAVQEWLQGLLQSTNSRCSAVRQLTTAITETLQSHEKLARAETDYIRRVGENIAGNLEEVDVEMLAEAAFNKGLPIKDVVTRFSKALEGQVKVVLEDGIQQTTEPGKMFRSWVRRDYSALSSEVKELVPEDISIVESTRDETRVDTQPGPSLDARVDQALQGAFETLHEKLGSYLNALSLLNGLLKVIDDTNKTDNENRGETETGTGPTTENDPSAQESEASETIEGETPEPQELTLPPVSRREIILKQATRVTVTTTLIREARKLLGEIRVKAIEITEAEANSITAGLCKASDLEFFPLREILRNEGRLCRDMSQLITGYLGNLDLSR